jgi:tropomyosin, fungi type
VLDGDLEKAESKLAEAKQSSSDGETTKTTNEGLQRKVQLLEEELDAAEKNVKETVEKYVCYLSFPIFQMTLSS